MATATSQTDRLTQQQTLVYQEMQLLMNAATRDQRAFSSDEEARFTKLKEQHAQFERQIATVASDDELRDRVATLTNGRGRSGAGPRHAGGSSPGALFAEGVGDFFTNGGHHASGAWRSPAVEIPYPALFQATTLTETPGSAGALVVPDYRVGIIPSATRPIVVMDVLMPGSTNSNAVIYMQESAYTNAAAVVAEGTAKPESALVFVQVSEPVLKVAHWLPASEELLEDVSAMSSYIDGRLRLGVQLAEDDQLLNGAGAPNFTGLLHRAGLAATVTQGAGESAADAILRQIAAISTAAYVPPTGIVMNPADYLGMQTLKATTGEYIGASPFETPIQPTLWGLPLALTVAIAPKTALVGAFATQAQFFRRGALRVEASNSHQDFFIKNLVAIRAEERGALAVYRPAAFGKVTLL